MLRKSKCVLKLSRKKLAKYKERCIFAFQIFLERCIFVVYIFITIVVIILSTEQENTGAINKQRLP